MNAQETSDTPTATAAGGDLIRAIGQVAAVVAAGVGVIYALGGLIIWLRLLLISKPQLAVVSELPREVVSALGLVVVVLALALGAAYAVWRLVWHPEQETPPQLSPKFLKTLGLAVRPFAALAGLLAAPTVFILLVTHIREQETFGIATEWALPLSAALVFLLAVAWAGFALRMHERLGEVYWVRAVQEATQHRSDAAGRDAKLAREAAEQARVDVERAETAAQQAEEAARAAKEDAERPASHGTDAQMQEDQQRAENALVHAKDERDRAEGKKDEWRQLEERRKEAAKRLLGLETNGSPLERTHEEVTAFAITGFNSTAAIALSALLWALVWLPAFVAAASALPLANAQACVASGGAVTGQFIGETGERVFLADDRADRIVSLSLERLGALYIGDEASEGTACP